MSQYTFHDLLTLPNLLTCFRFVSAPILLWLAWSGLGDAFLLLLAVTFLSDILDGMAARFLHQESELGALLDSTADLLIYTTMAISIGWLWPDIVQREIVFIIIAIASFVLPVLIGILKFHRFTSYHTWLVKAAVVSIGIAFFILFIFDISLPFRIAAFITLLAAIEEIAITFYLTEAHSNVQSLWHIRKKFNHDPE
ncbi:MAG: CDP-alcohol phosphatidyltransferase family protein [Piscirickettsiaceae bacterium]|nr:CDP-alcohol phosphatidyltransferase family protein [Piscirickettsiaceae bacterium]